MTQQNCFAGSVTRNQTHSKHGGDKNEHKHRTRSPLRPHPDRRNRTPWAFFDEAKHPDRITTGAIVITGDKEDPVFARVRSRTHRPSGTKVHLEILPGDPLDYLDAMRRTRLLTA